MYSLIVRLFHRYSQVLILPFTALIGFIGYTVENLVSDKYTPSLKSVQEERSEKQLKEEKEVESLKEHKFVPKTIFEKNLPPSLRGPDPRLKKYGKES